MKVNLYIFIYPDDDGAWRVSSDERATGLTFDNGDAAVYWMGDAHRDRAVWELRAIADAIEALPREGGASPREGGS